MKHARPSGTPRGPRPVPDGAARAADETTPPAPDGTQDTEAGTTTVTGTKGGLGRSSMLMASGTAVSRILGLVRNVLLITAIGTTGLAADAFDVANKIPNVLFAILAGGVLNAVLVPQIIRAFRSKNPQERLDKLLTLSGVLLLGLSLLLTSASTIIVSLYTDGWGSAQFSLAVAFAFWCIPQLFFYGLYTLLGQVLNARGQFGPFMWAPVVNNVVSIVGFLAFIVIYGPYATGAVEDLGTWDGAKIALLAGTATLGVASQALILILPLWRSGFRWHFRLGLHGIGLRSAGQVAIWTFGAVILEQIGVLFTTQFASSAPAAALRQTFGDYASDPAALGMVTGVVTGAPEAFSVAGNAAYTQALMIYLLPHSLVTVSIATALFTGMSAAAGAGDFARVRHDLSRGVRTVGVFTVFATAVFAILALPLTKLLLINVSPSGAVAVSQILVAMAFGLVPLGGMVLMKWVYFAYEDGKTVFMIQVPATVALVGIAWLATRTLDPVWWVVGVGAAMSLSNMIVVLLRTAGLRRKLHGLDAFRIVRMHVKTILAAGASAAVGWGVLQLFGDLYGLSWLRAAVITAVVGIVMTVVYIGGLKAMRVRELDQLADPLLRKLGRRRPATR
ncbi:murein biosynthesis integral membrane protein MurJ [Oerskovia sp. NPDC060338]|uniref:murein biosynthesis integral membrane protein MurJ n=1 Tax=Oerskovia sp. NPDC060338 TaxID=3347100 RepID=UPI003648241C